MNEVVVQENGYEITYDGDSRDHDILQIRKGDQVVRLGMVVTSTDEAQRCTGVPPGQKGEVVRLNHPHRVATTSDFIVVLGQTRRWHWRTSLTL